MKKFPTVIFYDSNCNFCLRSIVFIEKRKRSNATRCIAINSPDFRDFRQEHRLSDIPDSLILYHCGKIYTHSTAAIRVFGLLRFPWNMLLVLLLCPPVIRDAIYRYLARKRYRWFGTCNNCTIPQ